MQMPPVRLYNQMRWDFTATQKLDKGKYKLQNNQRKDATVDTVFEMRFQQQNDWRLYTLVLWEQRTVEFLQNNYQNAP